MGMWRHRTPLDRLKTAEAGKRPARRPLLLRVAHRLGRWAPLMAVVRYRPLLHRAGLIGRLRPEEVFGLKVLLGSGATVAFLPLFARGSLSGVLRSLRRLWRAFFYRTFGCACRLPLGAAKQPALCLILWICWQRQSLPV